MEKKNQDWRSDLCRVLAILARYLITRTPSSLSVYLQRIPLEHIRPRILYTRPQKYSFCLFLASTSFYPLGTSSSLVIKYISCTCYLPSASTSVFCCGVFRYTLGTYLHRPPLVTGRLLASSAVGSLITDCGTRSHSLAYHQVISLLYHLRIPPTSLLNTPLSSDLGNQKHGFPTIVSKPIPTRRESGVWVFQVVPWTK